MRALSARLQRVRITCGDWRRVVTPSVHRARTGGDGARALFLDPPYATSGDLYAGSSRPVTQEVEAWCMSAPAELRIVLAGYGGDHDALLGHGWTKTTGRAGRGSGYHRDPMAGRRERLWMSPACITTEQGVLL